MVRFVFERRITNKLCEYWNTIRGDRLFPSFEGFDKDEISDIWSENCFLIKVIYEDSFDTFDYKIIHLGEKINQLHSEVNIELQGNLISNDLENVEQYLESVLDNKDYIIDEIDVDYLDKTLKARQCFLPLGKDDKVEYIVGALNYIF